VPSSVPAVKPGLRQFLATTTGLTPTAGVTVHSADPDPRQLTKESVILGQVSAPQEQAGLGPRRAETATLTCTILVSKPGVGETAIETARSRVYELEALLVGALAEDPTAGGVVPPPGQLKVTSSTLDEAPVDWDGSAMRQARLQLSIGWTSHII
jgi:hypothetical protein